MLTRGIFMHHLPLKIIFITDCIVQHNFKCSMKKIFLFINAACIFTFLSAQPPGRSGVWNAQGNFTQYLNKTLVESTTKPGSENMINSFNNEDNTIGKRFLFNEWVDGDSVIDVQGNLINTEAFIFNFDKTTGSLLASQDKINNMLVAPSGVQSFILKSMGKRYFFTHVNTISASQFYLELVQSDTHYSLYKRYATKYIAANFRNDGVIQTGNNYNEYKDEDEYYVVDGVTKASQQVSLKAKALKTTFAADKEKVNKYFKDNNSSEINEKFLTGLVAYLNQ